MKIERVIEWDWPQKPTVMDFLDFGGPINIVIELDVGTGGMKKKPSALDFDMSRLKPYSGTLPRITVEDKRENFTKMRDKWLKEPINVTVHVLRNPDELMWWVFRSPPEYTKDDSTMKHILKMVFK